MMESAKGSGTSRPAHFAQQRGASMAAGTPAELPTAGVYAAMLATLVLPAGPRPCRVPV
jgi:hypothetical protein